MGVSVDFTLRGYTLNCRVEEAVVAGEEAVVAGELEATLSYR